MPNVIPAFWVSVLISAGIASIVAMGMYFSCCAGALSAAHAALVGMGGYLGAVLTTNFGYPFPLAILAGLLLGLAVGALLAALTIRMDPLVAGLTTLAFGEVVSIIAYNISYIGGANSFVGVPLATNIGVVYLVLAAVVYAAWRFDSSRLGFAARACRDDMEAASASGINVPHVKMLVFAVGGAIAGVAGVLRVHYVLVQNPGDMGFWYSVNYIIFWVFGGSYHFLGPLFGAMFLTIVPELLRFSVYERFIMYGLILAAVTILRPEGVIHRKMFARA